MHPASHLEHTKEYLVKEKTQYFYLLAHGMSYD